MRHNQIRSIVVYSVHMPVHLPALRWNRWSKSSQISFWRYSTVRIDQLKIQGFRGFNALQTLTFHSRLTVIYAPNSYGKTSISEAIEWLLYGTTSKLDHADSKEQYRGSLRNQHLPD